MSQVTAALTLLQLHNSYLLHITLRFQQHSTQLDAAYCTLQFSRLIRVPGSLTYMLLHISGIRLKLLVSLLLLLTPTLVFITFYKNTSYHIFNKIIFLIRSYFNKLDLRQLYSKFCLKCFGKFPKNFPYYIYANSNYT